MQKLQKLKIDKYVEGILRTTIHVPAWLVWLAVRALPREAVRALAAEGLDLSEVLRARALGERTHLEITEGRQRKRVIVSLT